MKKLKSILITIILLIVLLLAGIFIYTFNNQSALLYCSPDEPRGSDIETWEKVINPAKTSVHLDKDFLNNFTVGTEAASYTVKHPSKMPPDNPFPVEVSELAPEESLNIGVGTIKYAGIGIAYYDVNQSLNEDAAFHFYDEKARKMSEAQISEFEIWNRTEIKESFKYNPFPSIQFIFVPEGIEDVMFHNIQVFDSQTHNLIGSGGSSYYGPKSIRFNPHVTLLHRAPVDVVFEVSYGPSETYEFTPEDGEGFQNENFECRLLHVFDGADPHTMSSESDATTYTNIIHKDMTGDPAECFFFVCQPQASFMPVTFEFFDKDGKRIQTQSGSTSYFTQRTLIKKSTGKVALIKARYRTKRQRIILHLPYIPGLPEQNDDVKNLFDVYIPHASLDSASQVGWFLKETLQLRNSSVTGSTPANSYNNFTYPVDFTDVTVRDIAKFYGTGGTLNADITNDRLELKYPVPFRVKLKQLLQKIFQKKSTPLQRQNTISPK